MKRLTEKNEFGDYVGSNLLDDECLCRGLSFDEMNEMTECFNKLGKLEDLEEKLGIDLITLFKAIHNGVWVKNSEQGIHFISLIDWLCEVGKIGNQLKPLFAFSVWKGNEEDADDFVYFIKDYGKTWALTKEELQ